MSKIVKNGLEAVQKTEFIFLEGGRIEVRNAYVFWTNFAGVPNQFGNATRNFNLAVTPEMGKELLKLGWRVKERDLLEDDIPVDKLFFINVKINMNSAYPPIISLYSEFKGSRTKRALDIDTISELDRIDIKSCDLIINPYKSEKFQGKITGYLYKLNAIQEPDIEFGGKYDDWLDEEDDCLANGTCSLEEWEAMHNQD